MTEIDEILNEFRYFRTQTLDLLDSLSVDDWQASVDQSIGPVWQQVRHLGRVEENYLKALETHEMKFDLADGSFSGEPTPENLKAYLMSLDETLMQEAKGFDSRTKIDWMGEAVSIASHVRRLTDHELVHIGSFLVLFKSRGHTFPESWKIWGL